MIGRLTGKVSDLLPNGLILDVNGIGYRVEGVTDALENDEISLYIYTHVREQELRLFGFRSKDTLIMFEKLLEVQGIGPKIALKLVNQIDLQDIVSAIANEDFTALKVSGLGEKLAKKIIIDLKNKINKEQVLISNFKPISKEITDIIDALLSLGYRSDRVESVLKQIDTEGKTQQSIIKEALNLLNQIVNK